MGTPAVLDLEPLLAPASQENPCGASVRWDPVFDVIKQARREESKDAYEDRAVKPDWVLIVTSASDLLANRSKDLMIAGYLTEALTRLHGFAGLRDGLRVVNGLLETYWDGLHPQAEGDDVEPRAAPIVWLTEPDRGARLPNRIREIPLAPDRGDDQVCSWSFWKSRFTPARGETEDESAYAKRKAEAEERAKQFEDTVATVPVGYYVNLRDDLQECVREVTRLGQLLDTRFGRAAPGVGALRQSLEECGALVTRILKDKGGLEPAAAGEAETPAAGTAEAGTVSAGAASGGPIRSRADALRRLAEVAAYFRQTEPHSPVSYLVQRAASWGEMSFTQLLDELVKDSSVREQIGDLLGINRRTEG